jgi:type I restriction enzyme, R subunit
LAEDELALFDLLRRDDLDKTSHERVKQASRELLGAIKTLLRGLDRFWEKEETKADVEVFILNKVFASLPSPPFTADDKSQVMRDVVSWARPHNVSSRKMSRQKRDYRRAAGPSRGGVRFRV